MTLLPVGGNVAPTGTFSLPGGSTLVASITAKPFTGVDTFSNTVFSGNLSENVYKDAAGMLFEYSFANTGANGGSDAIELMSTVNYAGFTTSVDATGSGVSPFTISRSTGSGSVIDFFFSGVPLGSSSDSLWIQTNADNFTVISTALQDGGNTSLSTFGPAATPEASTMLMFGMGTLGLVGLRNRKRS